MDLVQGAGSGESSHPDIGVAASNNQNWAVYTGREKRCGGTMDAPCASKDGAVYTVYHNIFTDSICSGVSEFVIAVSMEHYVLLLLMYWAS